MAIKTKHKEVEFGVGDSVSVGVIIKEKEKERIQYFEGVVIRIQGRGNNKTFTVRRIGAQQVGIERIFPVHSPSIASVSVKRGGHKGVRHAKLYYTRNKSKKEIEKIYTRHNKKNAAQPKKSTSKKSPRKKSAASKKK